MRILIIRHAEPNYSIDSLTEKGMREAKYLSERLKNAGIKYAYVSPLGRAKKTAEIGLSYTDVKPVECDFLHEFRGECYHREINGNKICWDIMPIDWANDKEFYDVDGWRNLELVKGTNIIEEYDKVANGLDEILASHGYNRNGMIYSTEKSNTDTIALFCHFGVESILLSHLLNISPFVLLQNTCALPSSVTSVYSEEREKGIVSFRMSCFGDVSHLYANNEEPSFMARFCEIYDSEDRH